MNKPTLFISLLLLASLSIIWATSKMSKPQKKSSGGIDKNMESKQQPFILELTADNAQNTIAKAQGILVVDFYAEWCGPCKTLKPVFEEVATELKSNYMFAKLNIDSCKEVAQKYQITSIPTIIIFSNGNIAERINGLISKELLLEKIEAAVKGPKDLSQLSQEELNQKLMQALQGMASLQDIERFLDAGADVNYTQETGLTPLMLTLVVNIPSGGDATQLVQLLLSYGAKTEFVQNGQTIQALDFVNMISQNYKRMAENFDKVAAILNQDQKKSKCSGNSCSL
jgi:thioredoxin 1